MLQGILAHQDSMGNRFLLKADDGAGIENESGNLILEFVADITAHFLIFDLG